MLDDKDVFVAGTFEITRMRNFVDLVVAIAKDQRYFVDLVEAVAKDQRSVVAHPVAKACHTLAKLLKTGTIPENIDRELKEMGLLP